MEKTMTSRLRFPEEGRAGEAILRDLSKMKENDIDWKAGRTWSLVYYINEDHLELIKRAYNLFFSENTINPYAFQSVQRLEHELIRMTLDMLHGDKEEVGSVTSGGTESILLALYTYREWARRKHPRIRQPEMVVPASIHPAFYKGAHLLGLTLREVPLRGDWRADAAAMEAAMTPNTILVAASAPSYPYGVIDPIAEIGAAAQRRGIPFHVDACIGGFMLPWVEALGHDLPVWDFRVPGVTSISADLHKFAYGAKGASTLTFRSMDYMRYQFFILSDWCGGVYASPSLVGTRPVGPMAAAWAAMQSLGREGYIGIAREVMDAVARLRAGLDAIPEIEVVGQPHMNLLAYTTRGNRPDLFVVADRLAERGWLVDRQKEPHSIHIGIMSHNIPVIDEYLADLKDAVEWARANPGATSEGNAALYGLMARLPFRGMIEENVRQVFENMYTPESTASASPDAVPRWQGWLNRLLAGWARWRGDRK